MNGWHAILRELLGNHCVNKVTSIVTPSFFTHQEVLWRCVDEGYYSPVSLLKIPQWRSKSDLEPAQPEQSSITAAVAWQRALLVIKLLLRSTGKCGNWLNRSLQQRVFTQKEKHSETKQHYITTSASYDNNWHNGKTHCETDGTWSLCVVNMIIPYIWEEIYLNWII